MPPIHTKVCAMDREAETHLVEEVVREAVGVGPAFGVSTPVDRIAHRCPPRSLLTGSCKMPQRRPWACT